MRLWLNWLFSSQTWSFSILETFLSFQMPRRIIKGQFVSSVWRKVSVSAKFKCYFSPKWMFHIIKRFKALESRVFSHRILTALFRAVIPRRKPRLVLEPYFENTLTIFTHKFTATETPKSISIMINHPDLGVLNIFFNPIVFITSCDTHLMHR